MNVHGESGSSEPTPPAAAETVLSPRRLGRSEPSAPDIEASHVTGAGARGTDRAPPIGTTLKGRYLLEEIAGEGGMGIVYRARDIEEQRIAGAEQLVAIKVLRPEFREHPDSVRALFEEVRNTRELAHPNIVSVYGCQEDGPHVFMTMQYLEGKTLDALLSEDIARGLPWERARPIIAGIGSALAYAHDRGVIHCDLKPSNVFLTLSGVPKVLDFGIAQAARRARDGRFDAGSLRALTLPYASPEMIRAWREDESARDEARVYSPKTSDDIYSFGCLVYELLTGRHPYDGRDAEEARAAGSACSRIAGISASQNRAIRKALSFDAAQRFARVEDFVGSLLDHRPPNVKVISVIGAALVVVAVSTWPLWRSGRVTSTSKPVVPSPGVSATPLPAPSRDAPGPLPLPPAAAGPFEFTGARLGSLRADDRGRICNQLDQSWRKFDCSAQKLCLAVRAEVVGKEADELQADDAEDAARLRRAQTAYSKLQAESCADIQADWPEVQRTLQESEPK